MKVLLPICIFSNAVNGTSRAELLSCWPIPLLSVGMYAGLIAVFAVVSKWLVREPEMLLFPVLYWLAASRLCHDAEMVRTLAIVSALPTMTTVAMLSKANGEHGDYGLGIVIATTIMSLVTLTVVSYVIL